jgi:methylphosphotriester-DNA--protein-cysteine methyltransferase
MRQLERMAKRYYGLPPKTLARKYRALRAASALARGEDLDDAGLGDSFYDQSHLIREVKRFAGLTPKQIRTSVLQSGVARGRKKLKGKVGPLVSDS